MKVAVAILNWNGITLLEKYLAAVVENSSSADIYVIDNASEDESVAFIQNNFPNVSIIRNPKNLGFAGGYNVGLRHIQADVICLLNNDVKVSENWIEPILKVYKENENVAIVQPKILDLKNKTRFEYAGAAGGFIDKFGYPYCRGRLFNSIEDDKDQYNDVTDIFWASGACFFIKSSVFSALDGFDSDFFAHMEEIDLCWRAINAGHTIKYVGHSEIYHLGAATLSENHPRKTYLNFRNSLFMLCKNLPSGQLALTLIQRLILDGIAGLKFFMEARMDHSLAVVHAHFSFYRNLPRLLSQRTGLTKTKNYYKKRSVVWAYFVNRKKTYGSL